MLKLDLNLISVQLLDLTRVQLCNSNIFDLLWTYWLFNKFYQAVGWLLGQKYKALIIIDNFKVFVQCNLWFFVICKDHG